MANEPAPPPSDAADWREMKTPPHDDLPRVVESVAEADKAHRLTLARMGHVGVEMPTTWWARDPQPEGERVYGLVRGDGGRHGPYFVTVYVVGGARWPSFNEWAPLVDVACVRGAVMSLTYAAGMGYPMNAEPVRSLVVAQSTAVEGSEARERMEAAHRDSLVLPQGGPRG